MKKLYTITAAALVSASAFAQAEPCSELFFSEYCEGSGNNKGMEIYNPTDSPIDLGPYVFQRFSNGEISSTDELNLQGTIQPYSTWVIVNGQTEDVELGGGSISPAVDPAMQELANQLDNPYPAPTYMNGDDAMVLVKDGSTIIDIFGKPGEDPGAAWTDDAEAGYVTTDGSTFLTANHTLRRKPTVTSGVVLPPTAFNTLLEYDSLTINQWNGLGLHCCQCDPSYDPEVCTGESVSVQELATSINFNIFPNPAQDKVTVSGEERMSRIEVYSQEGKLVINENLSQLSPLSTNLEVADLVAGRYIINIHLESGVVVTQALIKQ